MTIDGPVTVISQPDPSHQQRDADQRAQARFENKINTWTLVFAAIAGFGAFGAYRANRRSAKAAETHVELLKRQIADARTDAAEQRRIAIDALAETRKAADAAKNSAEVADRQLHLVHQQWLTMVKWRIFDVASASTGLRRRMVSAVCS